MIYEDLKVPIFHNELCLLMVDTIKQVSSKSKGIPQWNEKIWFAVVAVFFCSTLDSYKINTVIEF